MEAVDKLCVRQFYCDATICNPFHDANYTKRVTWSQTVSWCHVLLSESISAGGRSTWLEFSVAQVSIIEVGSAATGFSAWEAFGDSRSGNANLSVSSGSPNANASFPKRKNFSDWREEKTFSDDVT